MHVGPGDTVLAGSTVATNTSLVGAEIERLYARCDSVVLGVVTLPSIAPGDPICHLGILEASQPGPGPRGIERTRDRLPDDHPHARALGDLATNLLVTDELPPDVEDDLETDEGVGHEEEA